MPLSGRTVLITGAARRIGRYLAVQLGQSGAKVLLHYNTSSSEAEEVAQEIRRAGGEAWILQADLADPSRVQAKFNEASAISIPDILVNNASIFAPLDWSETTLEHWQHHMNVNLTAPFLLTQAFAKSLPGEKSGRVINMLDWRALRPGPDHFPYTVSKAGLTALTRSLASALAPRITVNGVALGAILPPSDSGDTLAPIQAVPAKRWAELDEVWQTVLFLLTGPDYITGEIIHLDGGRHLV